MGGQAYNAYVKQGTPWYKVITNYNAYVKQGTSWY